MFFFCNDFVENIDCDHVKLGLPNTYTDLFVFYLIFVAVIEYMKKKKINRWRSCCLN